MKTSRRARIVLPLVSLVTVFALSARAEPNGPPPKGAAKPAAHAAPAHPGSGPGAGHAGSGPRAGHAGTGPGGGHAAGAGPGAGHAGAGPGHGPQNAHIARGHVRARNFGGHAYHGRLAWEGGRWRHEMHNGRDGWWWDVGGAWYFYPQQMDGPPTYVSDVEVMDDVADGPPVEDGYAPPPGAYAPPPPPPPDPAASAAGGAIVGGLLGGLLTGRPSGVIAGAAAGGVTGAIVGAQAASRPGYYLAQGTCYYRYPSGQYVPADPRACY
jgi:hypothetical protein